MNISYHWLKKYIDFELTAQELADVLTSIGLETGNIREIQTIQGGLEGLVVGEVLTCTKHPNSDHLHITTVDIATEHPLQIICGAPNIAAGQKVIVAPIGTTLYSENKPFSIKKTKIRGEHSFGMICAEDEIGIGNDHQGIIVLPHEVPIGTPAKKYYNIESDYVLEVDITPNRIDAASHFGVARDLAAYLTHNGIKNTLKQPETCTIIENQSTGKHLSVKVENVEACPRYSGVTIRNVQVAESPQWLKNELTLIGLNPINNIVDITNYVLHELGHPLHAFDLDKLTGNQIIVKNLPEGTKFTTLDGVERNLNNQDLMICDANTGQCLAGVFGGLHSGVTNDTTNIFLECAYFNPTHIRKTARRHGLNTDSSFRFERGCDPNNTIQVLKRAITLILQIVGGEIAGNIQDFYPTPIEKNTIELNYSKIHSLIGKTLSPDTIKSILYSLEVDIIRETTSSLTIQVPTYRVDVTREVDIIEEILRIYGYNNIEFGESLHSSLSPLSGADISYNLQNLISEQLSANGFYEILNNSLSKETYYINNSTFPIEKSVKLLNPLSTDLNVMRQTLLYGGLENIVHNRNRQISDIRFYEFGNVYTLTNDNNNSQTPTQPYHEAFHLGIWLSGNAIGNSWIHPNEKLTIYHLKAYVENILTRIGFSLKNIGYQNIHNNIYTTAIHITEKNKVIGTLGIVSPHILKGIGLHSEVFFAELNWSSLVKSVQKHKITSTDIPKYPEVRRDFALLVDKNIRFVDIERVSLKAEKKLLKRVTLFDVYEGKNLPEGKKSYAVNFVLQDEENTLNDKHIEAIMKKIQTALEKELEASLR